MPPKATDEGVTASAQKRRGAARWARCETGAPKHARRRGRGKQVNSSESGGRRRLGGHHLHCVTLCHRRRKWSRTMFALCSESGRGISEERNFLAESTASEPAPDRRPLSRSGHGRGDAEDVCDRPAHPYARSLLASVPAPDVQAQRERRRVRGLTLATSWVGATSSSGCPFAPRCPFAADVCAAAPPPLVEVGADRRVACVRTK